MDNHIQLENADIVILALARWDGLYSSPAFSLAKKLAQTNRVFYIDNPFTFSDFFKTKFRPQIKRRYNQLFQIKKAWYQQPDFPNNLFLITPPLVFPVNLLPEGKMYDFSNGINSARTGKVVNHIIEEFQIKKYIFINCFNPFYGFPDKASVKPLLKFYYTIDEITQSNYIKKHGPKLERQMLSQADVILATSRKLVSNCQEVSDHAFYFPNAADFSLFNSSVSEEYERPAELKGLEHKKVICYTGHLEHRTDFKLLHHITQAHSDKVFLMVGPVSGTEPYTSGFTALPNVIFTGPKSINELPAYLKYSDCTIIPYKRNSLTAGIYPLKINEYLAAGKPVVATPFSTDILSFSEVIELADNEEDFSVKIEESVQAVNQAKTERRIDYARKNTWDARAGEFWSIAKSQAADLGK